ncbi:SGNH/GDSL hydrolase family protein [Rhodococcus ruber]|uniref:SGNH/GDSL hydrolase family protein n=1 Tax=Rhodococcus ruber TaxID=1830 RepID=A0ABT4MA27_9NOCA|nr:SGNH/GDSL hydrolase family protein [Rhodococcus ruber]MCZ4517811.1 SGNH/GDSL hydrolase family protein [Rhodococcus ruber]
MVKEKDQLRYVALGDSQTEGLNDGDEEMGFRGWADRLAEHMAGSDDGIAYANLAVRGRKAAQVRAEQLPAALALRPTVASVAAGVNDILRPNFDARTVAGELGAMFGALRSIDCTVITMTFPRLARPVPGRAVIARRMAELNVEIRRVAEEFGVVVIDLEQHDVASDPRLWSWDRLHLNETGHARLAAAAAYALGLPGATDAWNRPLAPLTRPHLFSRVRADLAWAGMFLAPWLARRVLRRSSGDSRTAKRPELTSLVG